MPIHKTDINISLVSRLITTQFPQWGDLPIKPVEISGWDNRTFRLGEDMSVRLPSAEGYSPQVEKEHRWLPRLAPHLPLPIPAPLAKGLPAEGYPWPWSVYRWIEGESAALERIVDLPQFATALAQFLVVLQQIDTTGGLPPGPHNFFRGGPLTVYDADTRNTLVILDGEIDTGAATEVWEAALEATRHGLPVWIHGDITAGNLLVRDGSLAAVIDFGCSGVGDPACDLTIAWTLLSRESRTAFRTALPLDNSTWVRARGWALWKALLTLVEHIHTNTIEAEKAKGVVDEVLADPID